MRYKLDAIRTVNIKRLARLSYLLAMRWDRRSELHSALKLAQHLWNYRLCRRHRAIDLVICPSRFMQRLMRRFNTRFLPNPAGAAITGSNRSNDLRMVFVGRVEPEKGLEDFLELIPSDFSARLEVIGNGSSLPLCRAVCRRRRLDDRVRFLGELPHSEALSQIAAAHVLVLPSRWPENCPMSLLEAMAVGTNILVADIGAMREMVEASGVGLRFTPGDRTSVRSAMRAIQHQYEAGVLNNFDVTAFLARRSRASYLKGLLSAYEVSPDDPSYDRPNGEVAD